MICLTDGPTSLAAAATGYAVFGWHIFPCHSAIESRCSCGRSECDNVAKHPRTKRGLKDATTDPIQISRWWPPAAKAHSNVAVATGKTSRIIVVDIDPRHGGQDTLLHLETQLGVLARDWCVTTGGGGMHMYFLHPGDVEIKSRNGWRQGIDIKADGGYVIAPPSVHQSGQRYEWRTQPQNEPPQLPPNWLSAIVDRDKTLPARRTATADAHSMLLQRAQQYAASVSGAGEGVRNKTAFSLAGHIASLITDTGETLSESDILGVVQSWNMRCNPPIPDVELRTCVASALQNGEPRAAKEVRVATVSAVVNEEAAPEKQKKTQATMLVELAEEAELFHDPDGEAYARFPVGDVDDMHWQVARVRTRPFKRWLAQRFYRTERKVPAAQAQQDALGVIEAKAVFDGDRRQVEIRVADHEGRIYFDLCNDHWQVVEIDKSGWRILDVSPVMFRRSKAMLAMPTPDHHGDVQEFRRFANVTDEDWPLVLAWLVAAFRPIGPYPVLTVLGEHGSGKSGLCRRLRSLTDPNTSPLRGDYREPRDLMICANSGWVVALDNLSTIPAWLSDCFCRLSTGGGFSTRTLYENDEETIFDAIRPLMLNCIEEVVTRSDLLDRCMLVNLPRIEQNRRLPEKQLDREFEAARPRILGGLLSAVSTALGREDSVRLPSLPRMADFAVWATAAEPGLGLKAGQFLSAYQANREAGNETALEASPVGKAIVEFVTAVGQWSGTSTQLLEQLESYTDSKTCGLKSWPATPKSLGGIVKRLAPNLRDAGIGVEFGRKGRKGARTTTLNHQLEHLGNSSSAMSAPSATSKTPEICNSDADTTADANSAADADAIGPSSAPIEVFPEENAVADATDDADTKIPTRSREPAWTEV